MKKFLHVGPGGKSKSESSHVYKLDEWEEVRLDVNKDTNPHILGSMTDLSMIKDGDFSGICSSHNLEHIFAHEVAPTLLGFERILDSEGELFIEVPDLKVCAEAIIKGNFNKTLYESPAGPITPMDMIYGHAKHIAAGNHYMAHKIGFTAEVLLATLKACGFKSVIVMSSDYSLHCVAKKGEGLEEDLKKRVLAHLGVKS
jgi:predicted SAM-dependent methyltransferase